MLESNQSTLLSTIKEKKSPEGDNVNWMIQKSVESTQSMNQIWPFANAPFSEESITLHDISMLFNMKHI